MIKKSVKRGDIFGRLIVVKFHDRVNYKSYWKCGCDCKSDGIYNNDMVIVRESDLLSGNTKSCGCLKREMYNKMKKTKGNNYEE